MRLGLTLLWMGLVAGCRAHPATEADLRAGDLLLLAREDPGGALTGVELRRSSDGILDLELGVEPVHLFAFEESSLEAPGGAPLDPDTLEASLVGTGAVECGRCRLPGLPAPAVMSPGDRCPPPAWARRFDLLPDGDTLLVSVDPPAAARVAEQIRFGPPGSCVPASLPAVDLDPATSLELTPDAPDGSGADTWPVERFVLAPDGTLALFDQRYAKVIAPDGAVLGETHLLPFTDSLRAAVPLGDGFLVMSRSSRKNEPADRPARVRLDRFGRDLRSSEIEAGPEIATLLEASRLTTLGPSIERALAIPAGAGVLVSGKASGNMNTLVFACALAADRLAGCQPIESGVRFPGTIDALAVTDNGVLIVALNSAQHASVFRGAPVGGTWAWVRDEIEGNVDDVGADPSGRVFACGKRGSNLAAWTASVSPAAVVAGGPVSWTLRHDEPGDAEGCQIGTAARGRLVATWREGAGLAFDPATGEVGALDLPPLPGGGTPRYSQAIGGRTAIADRCGRIYAGTSSAVAPAHVWSSGPCVEALEVRDDGSLRGWGGGVERSFAPAPAVRAVPSLPEGRIVAAAWDACAEDTLIGTRRGLYWLRDGEVIRSDPRPIEIRRILSIGPCVRAVLLDDGVLLLERRGQLEPVVLPPGPNRGEASCINAIDARDGVIWAGGNCGLFRLVAGLPVRVDEPVQFPVGIKARPTAIHLLDIDHLVVIDDDSTLWEVAPDGTDRGLSVRPVGFVSEQTDRLFGDDQGLLGVGADDGRDFDPGPMLLAGTAIRGGFCGATDAVAGPDRVVRVLAQGRLLRLEPRLP